MAETNTSIRARVSYPNKIMCLDSPDEDGRASMLVDTHSGMVFLPLEVPPF
jgi:hypothetical protein